MSLQIGLEAEKSIAAYLQKQGYSILERNWRCRRGEVDLIAQKKQKLYFVEVKFRNSKSYGSALDSLTPSKLKKLAATALTYLQQAQKAKQDFAFAAVLVDQKNDEKSIQMFEFPLDLPLNSYY